MTALSRRVRLIAAWTGLLTIDVAIQLAMKIAADHLDAFPFPSLAWGAAVLGEPLALVALAGYFATFILWLAILHASPLSAAFPLTALTYVLVPVAAWGGLGEAISWPKAAGIALIVLGVVVQHTEEI